MRRVWTAVRIVESPPVPARLNSPSPSMKNGRFSLKKTGKRLLTSTSKASLSTWLKSGFMVASSVIVDVMPYFTLAPKSRLATGALPASAPAAATSLREKVALGITSSSSGWCSSPKATGACVSNTHSPGSISGHDHDMPRRLLRRKNSTPMRTSGPP